MAHASDSKSTTTAGPFVAIQHPVTSTAAHHRKVTIVGAGAVGMACAASILNQKLCSELVLIDIDRKKVDAEVLDLQHGMGASQMPVHVCGGDDLALTKHSHLCIVSAGVRQRPGEGRRELMARNAALLTPIITKLAKYSPRTILLMISNPVDMMTYLAWRVSGFPPSRVFGSGTTLDSSRFRHLLSERLHVPTPSVHGYVVGEHGDQSVPIWSSVNVFGTTLRHLYPRAGLSDDPDDFASITQQVVESAAKLIAAKGYTSWGIGLCCATLVRAILKDEAMILPVTTIVPARVNDDIAHAVGRLGRPVALSLPCQLDASGVRCILKLALDDDEQKRLHASAVKLSELQKQVDAILGSSPSPTYGDSLSAAPLISSKL